jgi:nitroreductase/NAD-dependent dihydropyrimidine dehydrogenase PreA subunit
MDIMTKEQIYTIDEKKCIDCGICQKECPAKCINKNEGFLSIIQNNCIQCGHCGAICPAGAISYAGEELPLINEHKITPEQAFNLIRGKRSVRQYKQEPISEETLDRIIETGTLTGTASNSRNVKAKLYSGNELIEIRQKICQRLLAIIKPLNNPIGRTIARWAGADKYADPELLNTFIDKLIKGAESTGDPLFFHAPQVAVLTYPKSDKQFGRTNAVLAGQSMMLYAHALGIESCIIGFAEVGTKGRKGKKILGIDKDRELGLIFTLGYGIPKYHRLPVRRSIAEA